MAAREGGHPSLALPDGILRHSFVLDTIEETYEFVGGRAMTGRIERSDGKTEPTSFPRRLVNRSLNGTVRPKAYKSHNRYVNRSQAT